MNGDRPNHLAWPPGVPFPGLPQPSPDDRSTGGPPPRDRRRSRALGQDITANMSGQIATWDAPNDEDSETLVAFLKAYDFAEGAIQGVDITNPLKDPYAGVAAAGIVPDTLSQALEVLGILQWGHDGVTKQVIMSLPASQVVKIPMAGSYARAESKLTSRYFLRQTGGAIAGSDTFFYLSANPNLRNNIFNNPKSPLLDPSQNFAPGTVPTTPIHVDGLIAKGSVSVATGGSSDRSARACRRFYGSVPTEAAGYPGAGALVFCPIAFGASAVMLAANPAGFAPPIDPAANPVRSPLLFAMVDHAGNWVGQLPPNQFVPLTANCQTIVVYNTAANGAENPFTLIYDLGL